MKIPLEFDEDRTRLSIVGSVRFHGHSPVPVLFVVDTGSPVTFVDEFNTAKVRIFTKNLKFDHDALLGGTKVAMYNGGKATLTFVTEDKALQPTVLDDLLVADTKWTRKSAIYSGTSILGLDFLLKNKGRLFVDPHNSSSHIEIL